jgi:hypothetical protein
MLARWAEPRLGLAPLGTILSPTANSLHIDAGKLSPPQQYNRFDERFQRFRTSSNNRNFCFDTPGSPPYKRGSHGERGVPKTSRRKSDEGFFDPIGSAPAAQGLDLPVVRSMHRLLGKGYAGGGERQL